MFERSQHWTPPGGQQDVPICQGAEDLVTADCSRTVDLRSVRRQARCALLQKLLEEEAESAGDQQVAPLRVH